MLILVNLTVIEVSIDNEHWLVSRRCLRHVTVFRSTAFGILPVTGRYYRRDGEPGNKTPRCNRRYRPGLFPGSHRETATDLLSRLFG